VRQLEREEHLDRASHVDLRAQCDVEDVDNRVCVALKELHGAFLVATNPSTLILTPQAHHVCDNSKG
jgi:hypothetical protein